MTIGIKSGKTPGFEEIYNNTSPTNTTVYCGGFPPNAITDELIQKHFAQFGHINDTRVFKDKGYAFIRFASKESAARAIEGTHNSEVQGHPVKCYWGKENGGDVNSNGMNTSAIAAAAASGMIGMNMNGMVSPLQQMQPNAAATAAAAMVAQQQHSANPQLTQASAAAAAAAGAQYPYSAAAYGQMAYWIPVSTVGSGLFVGFALYYSFCVFSSLYRVDIRRYRPSTCSKGTTPTRRRTHRQHRSKRVRQVSRILCTKEV